MSGAPIIAAEGLSKRFGALEVLRDVSLPVEEREVLCIIGPSGSGKTTLLRCFALLEKPSAGRVLMRGRVIAGGEEDAAMRRTVREVRADIGMVFQHFHLWPHMTVLQNVTEAPMLVKRAS